jgi:lon-related putative ATP-dependent protease
MDAIKPLPPERLFTPCDTSEWSFDSTAELTAPDRPYGQERAFDALQFGTRIVGSGYNIFALGEPGTGKFEAVQAVLAAEAGRRPVPPDWCYLYDFAQPYRPRALRGPAGRGTQLRDDMEQLIEDLGSAISAAFDTEEYHSRVEKIEQEFSERRDAALKELAEEAERRHVRLLHTPAGFAFAPLGPDGNVIRPDAFEKMAEAEQRAIQDGVEDLQKQLQRILRQFPVWQKEMWEKVRELDREMAGYAVDHLIADVKQKHSDLALVLDFLEQLQRDVVERVREFRTEPGAGGPMAAAMRGEALSRYKVNVLVNNREARSAPVVYQDLPTHANLVGRIEYRALMGTLVTDFTLIKAGDLHRANGGYLILDALRVLTQPFAWDTLKRALRSREARIESLERSLGLISTVSLEPEPIPLDVKVVLVGDRMLYYLLSYYDPEFADLFKVAADFEDAADRDGATSGALARLVAGIVARHGLLPFDRAALARMVEHGARLAGDAEKISTHLRVIEDLARAADYWARETGRTVATRADVQRAIDAQIRRLDRVRERLYEAIRRGTIGIATRGERPGQINGLSVLDLGGFAFGAPTRITATTRLGDGKVLDIQRETELGGKIHSKGVLILSGYLTSHYGAGHPPSFAASLVFEQSYGMVEGDSASLAELCALLSALAGVPIRQSFAVTGSINQLGEVQAIGGVNEKIEGFFDVCREAGMDGERAVIIPASNVPHLMLREDVVDAARAGGFRVYAVAHADQALELLTGIPAGARGADGGYPADSVNGKVEHTLHELARQRREFSKSAEFGAKPENG